MTVVPGEHTAANSYRWDLLKGPASLIQLCKETQGQHADEMRAVRQLSTIASESEQRHTRFTLLVSRRIGGF